MASISEEPKRYSGEWTESIKAMIEKFDSGTLEYNPDTEASLAANPISKPALRAKGGTTMFTKVKDLKTTHGAPVQYNKDYFIAEADAKTDRRLDLEDHKWKKVVMNPKWRDGLYMQLRKHDQYDEAFHLWYAGDEVWLCGRASDDVKMGKDKFSSTWFLREEGKDELEQPRYSLWTWRTDVMEMGGIYWPEESISRVGYNEDYELESYSQGSLPHVRWLYVKLLDPKDRHKRWYGGRMRVGV